MINSINFGQIYEVQHYLKIGVNSNYIVTQKLQSDIKIKNCHITFMTNQGKHVLQIRAAFLIKKSGNILLPIGAVFITNWGRYYKLGQVLQIGAN